VGGALAVLLQPRFRRHLCKLVYADEWAQSILESHAKVGAGAQAVVEKHYAEAGIIFKALTGVLAKELSLSAKADAVDLLTHIVSEIVDGTATDHRAPAGEPWF
jgi:hypothetical protein